MREKLYLLSSIRPMYSLQCSSLYIYVALPYIKEEFKPSVMPLTLSTALFILVSGIAPIFWGAVSDHYRIRRSVIVASLVIYSLSSVTCVLANDIWIIVLLRCCQAVGSSCSLSVGAVVIADTFSLDKRGSAFSKYSFGIFAGPLIGVTIHDIDLINSRCMYSSLSTLQDPLSAVRLYQRSTRGEAVSGSVSVTEQPCFYSSFVSCQKHAKMLMKQDSASSKSIRYRQSIFCAIHLSSSRRSFPASLLVGCMRSNLYCLFCIKRFTVLQLGKRVRIQKE